MILVSFLIERLRFRVESLTDLNLLFYLSHFEEHIYMRLR